MANIDRVSKAKHCISEPFQVGLPISEVSGCLFEPLAEPLSIFCGLSVSVSRHKKHAHRLTDALKGKVNTAHRKELNRRKKA